MANLLALPSNTSCNATAVPNRKDAKTPAICAGLTQQGTSIIDRALAEASSFCRRLSAIANLLSNRDGYVGESRVSAFFNCRFIARLISETVADRELIDQRSRKD